LRQISRRYPEQPKAGKRFALKTTGTPMAWIPPGDFKMGSRDPKDEGRHRVRLTKGYWMAQIEVTQAEYRKVTGTNPSRVTGSPYLPVDWVTWDQATAYCRKLTELERKAGRLPEGYEYRLPTEAEWEYACRAGSNEDFSVPQDQVWSRDCGGRRPHEVAESKPNNWGLYDMHGNALEWCFDAWYDYPKGNKEATVDPFTIGQPDKDQWFVVRGGAWWSTADGCSSHWRAPNHNNPNGFCGFRVVLGPEIRDPFGEVARFFDGEMFVECAVVSPDGRRVLSGAHNGLMILWDLESRRLIRRFRAHEGRVLTVAFAPDGRRALSGGDDKTIRLWDLESGETIREFPGHSEWVLSVAFSPDGRLAYSSSGGFWANGGWKDGDDSAVRVWDVETGSEIRKLVGHKGLVFRVAVSPDGRRLLSGGSDRNLILWDAKTGAEIRRLPGHTDAVEAVAFVRDGRRGVSCGWDDTIRIWDLDTGAEVHRFHPREGQPVAGLSYLTVSPDGGRLLCGCVGAHEVTLWDLEAGKLIHRFDWGDVAPVRGSFTPDGRHAVWPASDGVIRMYRLGPSNPATVERSARPPATKP
jgi:WD40 repeat protein